MQNPTSDKVVNSKVSCNYEERSYAQGHMRSIRPKFWGPSVLTKTHRNHAVLLRTSFKRSGEAKSKSI